MAQVQVDNLKKAFGNFWAVDGVTFSVEEGEIFGFLGPNGAGKTTTIRMLCGILRPTGGNIQIADINVVSHPERAKRIIGYMSQKFSLYPELKVRENLRFYGEVYRIPKRDLKKRIDEAISLFGLEPWEEALTEDLPGGVKQRLALACSTLHRPKILFLDEPTSGVDPVARKNFWKFIKEKKKEGVSTIVTTHYMEEAEFCDKIALIHQGRIKAIDTSMGLKETFLRDIGKVFEISFEEAKPFIKKMKEVPLIKDILPYGAYLHVIVTPSVSKEDFIKALKENFGSEASSFELYEVMPTLEDVFIGLLGGTT